MADEESTEHQFVQQVLSNFNPLESQMGEGAYNANVESMHANAELMRATAAMRRSWASLLMVLTMLLIAGGLAGVFAVWKWVLS